MGHLRTPMDDSNPWVVYRYQPQTHGCTHGARMGSSWVTQGLAIGRTWITHRYFLDETID